MTRTEEQKAFIWKATDRRRASFIDRAEKQVLGALNKQIAPVIAAVADGKKDIDSLIKDKPIQDAFINIYTTVGVAFAKEEFSKFKSSDLDYQTKAAAEESVWMRFMRKFALEKAGERIKNIGETTLKKVRSVLEVAVSEGYSIDKTANFMKDEFGIINKQRAVLISRTEILSSSNLGSYTGAVSTGLKLNKEWLSTPGQRTRVTHKAADGQIVDLNEDFKVNGEDMSYPGDPRGSASNVIACRCTILYNPK